jgi:hypothetical protein
VPQAPVEIALAHREHQVPFVTAPQSRDRPN